METQLNIDVHANMGFFFAALYCSLLEVHSDEGEKMLHTLWSKTHAVKVGH